MVLPARYDDGGFTGGNMERPALQRLFADIEAGEIDCVVVYKVDRLSRSLTNKNGRLYRYYVCLNAQQRGWSSCPSKSLNAQEIENAVVEHICGIGSNETIIAATPAKVREESEKRLAELNKERQSHERVLKRLHTRVQKLMSESFSVASGQKLAIDQLADLQDQIGSLDQRMTAIREEVISIQKEAVDEGDLARALTAFAPVWESLSP